MKKISRGFLFFIFVLILVFQFFYNKVISFKPAKIENIKELSTEEKIFEFNNQKNPMLTNQEPEASIFLAMNLNKKIGDREIITSKEREKIIQEIVLPPNKGFAYIVKKGDSLEKIAKKFGIKKEDLIAFNQIKNENFVREGQRLLIPSNKVQSMAKIISKISLKPIFVNALSSVGKLLVPVTGLNQRRAHSQNGIDISAECGSPVYSADSGIVIESYNGWNGGYGNYIAIQHKNYETLYGHLSQRFVEVGDYVEKGTLIATVGATGKATGCHLHFETRGIKNPLAY